VDDNFSVPADVVFKNVYKALEAKSTWICQLTAQNENHKHELMLEISKVPKQVHEAHHNFQF
jgi:hypothetical protein